MRAPRNDGAPRKSYGKPGLSMHKLRHSFATKFNKDNNNLEMLKEQLGHTDVNKRMEAVYVYAQKE